MSAINATMMAITATTSGMRVLPMRCANVGGSCGMLSGGVGSVTFDSMSAVTRNVGSGSPSGVLSALTDSGCAGISNGGNCGAVFKSCGGVTA